MFREGGVTARRTAALREFFEVYFDAVYNFASYRTGRNHHDAEVALKVMVFTSEHSWSPDSPHLDSAEEENQLAYDYAARKALRRGEGFLEAVEEGRKNPVKPTGRGEIARLT